MMQRLLVFVPLVSKAAVAQDYDSQCPAGWTAVQDGVCEAPLSYTGPCRSRSASFATEEAKKQFESACRVQWASEDSCEPDLGVPCPLGWQHEGDGICRAPIGYTGTCANRVKMFDDQYKRDFAARCDVSWPCAACSQSFGSTCPTGWSSFDNLCVAPRTYAGPCVPFANLNGFTTGEKKKYSELCGVQFCSETSAQPTCETSATCPEGWESIGGHCYLSSYTGPCRPLVSADDLGRLGKDAFAERCGVNFACLKYRTGAAGSDQEEEVPSGPIDASGRIVSALY